MRDDEWRDGLFDWAYRGFGIALGMFAFTLLLAIIWWIWIAASIDLFQRMFQVSLFN